MDFSLSDDQEQLRQAVIEFARRELNEGVLERDRDKIFSREGWDKSAGMGLLALPFEERFGGSGLSFLTTVTTIEAFAYGCTDAGLVHAVTATLLAGMLVDEFGSEDLKERYLPGLCTGSMLAGQAITEPDVGSDAMAMRTRAERSDDDWLLNGTKSFISNAPVAEFLIVFAVTNPARKAMGGITAFLVDGDAQGLAKSPPLDKMGIRTLHNGDLFFQDCRVPLGNVLGREGQGALIFAESMDWERVLLPAINLGAMQRILERCVGYAKERRAFGEPIGKFQSVSNVIADMKVSLEVGRLALYKAAVLKDQGRRANMEASIAKLYISEAAKRMALEGVQIHGGYGFATEYEMEREVRDAIAGTIYSGTSEIQRNVISRLLGL